MRSTAAHQQNSLQMQENRQSSAAIMSEDTAGAPLGVPHIVQCGYNDTYAQKSARMIAQVCALGAECDKPNGEPGGPQQISVWWRNGADHS